MILSVSKDAWWTNGHQFQVEASVLPFLTEQPADLTGWFYEEGGYYWHITNIAFLRKSKQDRTIDCIFIDVGDRNVAMERKEKIRNLCT